MRNGKGRWEQRGLGREREEGKTVHKKKGKRSGKIQKNSQHDTTTYFAQQHHLVMYLFRCLFLLPFLCLFPCLFLRVCFAFLLLCLSLCLCHYHLLLHSRFHSCSCLLSPDWMWERRNRARERKRKTRKKKRVKWSEGIECQSECAHHLKIPLRC